MIFSVNKIQVLQASLLFFTLASLVLATVLVIESQDITKTKDSVSGRGNDITVTGSLEDNRIRFPELSIGDQSFLLQPVSYLVRVRDTGSNLDDVVGTISNSALSYVDWFEDPIWFYETTSATALGIRHSPDTFTGGEEYLLVRTDGTSSVRIATSYLNGDFVVDFGYLSVNQVPEMQYEISTNLMDVACVRMPEEVLSDFATEAISDWLNGCNENHPLYISEIRVDDTFALSISRERVYRVPGGFGGQVAYKLDLPETTEIIAGPTFLGANEGLDVAYFRLSDQTYAIDRNGKVLLADLPSELVNIVPQHYEP